MASKIHSSVSIPRIYRYTRKLQKNLEKRIPQLAVKQIITNFHKSANLRPRNYADLDKAVRLYYSSIEQKYGKEKISSAELLSYLMIPIREFNNAAEVAPMERMYPKYKTGQFVREALGGICVIEQVEDFCKFSDKWIESKYAGKSKYQPYYWCKFSSNAQGQTPLVPEQDLVPVSEETVLAERPDLLEYSAKLKHKRAQAAINELKSQEKDEPKEEK